MSKIVVVDDEPFILMMIEDKLRRAGMQVITLRESGSAMSVISREKPDLVILDWMMPEISGIELCRTLKADPALKDIPVIMLTAKGQEADKQLGLECGASMFITKPFSPRSLLEVVNNAINMHD